MSKPPPTVDLRVSRSLELLGQLHKTVGDYAEKEKQLERKLRSSGFKSSRKYQEEIEATEAKLAAQQAEIAAGIENEEAPAHAVAGHRRAKVKRMHLVATKQNPRRGLAVREGWIGDQQMRKIVLKQRLAADQQAVEGEFAEFFAKLGEEKTKLAALRKKLEGYFGGYRSFKKMLRQAAEPSITTPPARPKPGLGGGQDALSSVGKPNTEGAQAENSFQKEGHESLLENLKSLRAEAQVQAHAFRRHFLPRLFSPALWLVWLFVILLASAGQVYQLSRHYPWEDAISYGLPAGLAIAVILWALHSLGFDRTKPDAEKLSQTIASATRLRLDSHESAKAAHELAHLNLQKQFDREAAEIDAQRARAPEIEKEFVAKAQAKIEAQLPRLLAKIDAQQSGRLAKAEAARHARMTGLQTNAAANIRQLRDAQSNETAATEAEEKAQWEALNRAWQGEIVPIYQAVEEINAVAATLAPAWNAAFVEAWQPAAAFQPGVAFARLETDMRGTNPAMPALSKLTLPGSNVGVEALADSESEEMIPESAKASTPTVTLPLVLTFPHQASLLFETPGSGEKAVTDTLNNLILQLLATIPPGKLSFTIIDPVGLGQNFAGLMHLSDYEESLINRRIWTQRDQIEERLEELSEHIEKVIQMYLRNEYATITEYNEQAGSVAEKYQFLVIADFPANFSESAAKRLQSIAASGPRCGIFTLIHRDTRQPLPEGFNVDELRRNSVCIRREGTAYVVGKEQAEAGATLVFNPPPAPALAVELVHKIGQGSIDSNRVQVPFRQIAPKEGEFWTNETTNELKIAVGRTGATKHQYLAIGKGTRQHALFAGKTGSGKSTLFHVIITNLALACSPEQVEFWLIDFKKGVEFKCYATKRLPHARVIAIESDREFALSVLQRVDGELKRRGDMFRKLGVQDIAGYQRAGGTEPMPRSLLLIDEFQEFFTEDDTVAQTASLLFDRIVRQGRAFGIHVLLGSQTLGGAYSLARATLGQMVIRVALQCNEADAYLIMDENNSAPRLLSRPGEGIYNDAAGAVEGNSPFQVVWLPDEERDQWLDKVSALNASSTQRRMASPIVFEGNAPADIRENDLLREVLKTKPSVAPVAARCWLGAPNSIKGPTEVVFNRQSGNHLLIVGQRDEAAITMLGLSLIALAAQYPAGAAKFVLVHASVPGSPDAVFMEEVVAAVPKENLVVSRGGDLAEIMNELASDLKSRLGNDTASDAPSVFLLIHGLHKFKKLRQEDDFSFSMSDDAPAANPGAQFNEIITEGSSHGLHILTTVDTLNNVNRCLSRKAQSEFELRVAFQMSANDSASLIDSPKASNLGLHRALLHNEHEGSLETFRPYAMPDAEWISQAGKQ